MGDVAADSNKVIQTLNFDRLHHESVRFERFCVSRTCAPTRAACMNSAWTQPIPPPAGLSCA
jgi:arylsulfatase A-like enzyme